MNRDPHAWARLGQAIAAARQAQRLTQSELADRADVSTGAVQRAEAGKVPKARMPITLHPIANALGWPSTAIDAVLDGGAVGSAGEYRDVKVQAVVDDEHLERAETIVSGAMVRALKSASSEEIRNATRNALDALRREGML